MSYVDHEELLVAAREYFIEDNYSQAEPILNQLVLKNSKSPEVFHMLGAIFYDNGKFSKAIRAFKRALELDPSFTDASVGLSIILNDLGRYDEGQKVFNDAKKVLDETRVKDDPFINEKLSTKHDELGDLYLHYGRPKEALEQFYKSLNLTTRKAEVTMKVVECYVKSGDLKKAAKALEDLIAIIPDFIPGRLKLAQIYYEQEELTKAKQQWQSVLSRQPDHPQAVKMINQLKHQQQISL
ncbi:MAG: tetratricopeptide repeat protein [Bdellovibrionales bacterium]|nr:tetratricopeptide repeat protein [Bdellovibrionales bacterium]